MNGADDVSRCEWGNGTALMRAYHDEEWGVPVFEDQKLFEFLLLDAFQAGLSWEIILKRREGFREAFCDFDPVAVSTLSDEGLETILQDAAIIRNRSKVFAARENAKAFLRTQTEFGAFSEYFWSFVGGKPIQNRWDGWHSIPAETEESRALSVDLRKRGFKFAGPTIIYAVMQSAGLVNDHVVTCFRYHELGGLGENGQE